MSWFSENVIDLGGNKKAPPPKKPTVTTAQADVQYVDSNSDSTLASPSDLQSFRDHFKNLLKQNNIPGNDYYEFVALKNHLGSIPVESEKYKAAYEGLAAAGLTKEILTQSATKYTNLIDRELTDFQAEYGNTYKTSVEANKARVLQKRKQMTDLSQTINQLNEEIKQMEDTISSNEQDLASKQVAFVKAHSEAKQEIATELDNISKYIS